MFIIVVTFAPYINFYNGTSRLGSCHLNYLSLVSSMSPKRQAKSSSRGGFRYCYFYRANLMWNLLPLSLGQIIGPGVFKGKLIDNIQKEVVSIDQLSNSHLTGNEIADSKDQVGTLSYIYVFFSVDQIQTQYTQKL